MTDLENIQRSIERSQKADAPTVKCTKKDLQKNLN